MATQFKKPFYLRSPLSILFDPRKLEKIVPWDIDIEYLLSTFLKTMEKTGQIDFRASGVALDSSARIYLMKSKLLLKLEDPPISPKIVKDIVPPPLFLPLRHELTSTTIKNLLEVLDSVLAGEQLTKKEKTTIKPILPTLQDLLPQIDLYLIEIEQQMEKLYEDLFQNVKGSGIIAFSKLIKDSKRLESIRTFILLLFLAQKRKVKLFQEEESEEIYIIVGEANIAKDEDAK
jgi:chromatin segregation and condensation protein Rec8/ScpA/Scc1 (kleisin family)